MTETAQTITVPSPGDVIEIPAKLHFRVDKVTYSRELVGSDNPIDGMGSYKLDGRRGKIVLTGEVIAP